MSSVPSGAREPEPGLLGAVRAGAPEAVDAWFRAEHPAVYRLCFGFLAHRAEAEDVAQEAMVQLLDRLGEWDGVRSYRAWRTTLVLNRCRDRVRRLERRRKHEDHAAGEWSRRVEGEPREALERAEVETALLTALESLPPREREAFVLRDLEGLETGEVARTLAIGESSVRSLVTLARQRLRGLLRLRLGAEEVP